MFHTMTDDHERIEREKRHERLNAAKVLAKVRGPKQLSDATKIKINTVKAHLSGRSDFGTAQARAYAAALQVSVVWLYLGIGRPNDPASKITNEELRRLFVLADSADHDTQVEIISYARFALGLDRARDTAAILAE